MKKSSVLVVQHHPVEGLGIIAQSCGMLPEMGPGIVAQSCGMLPETSTIVAHCCKIYEKQPVPKTIEGHDALILMGGPMSVYDSHPFLKEELRLIEDALKQNKPILGVCLGSQLLAAALGARVYPGKQKEIGWKSVRLNDFAMSDPLWQGVPRSLMAFHWHGDIFDLPVGAVPLAESDLTPCQAFRYGKAYGLLFHAEVTKDSIQGMVKAFADEIAKEGLKPQDLIAPAETHMANLHHVGATVFGRWAGLVG